MVASTKGSSKLVLGTVKVKCDTHLVRCISVIGLKMWCVLAQFICIFGSSSHNNYCLQRHGKGEFKDVDGSVYDGEWKDDLQDGKGVKIYANGAKYEVCKYSILIMK